MKTWLLMAGVVALACTALGAQAPVPDPAPDVPPPVTGEGSRDIWTPIVRVGQDYTLPAGAAAREVAVVFGDATIGGHVRRSVVVVLGTARLTGTAVIDDALVVVGGNAVAEPNARVARDVVIIGGESIGGTDFALGGTHVVIGSEAVAARLSAIVPWVTRGLLWGRPIVPDLPWVWSVVGVFLFVYLAVAVIFDGGVRMSASKMAEKPLSAFVIGLLVLLLVGPFSLLLTISIVGVAVVPLVICALMAALVLGKVAAASWIGMTILGHRHLERRSQVLATFLLGFAVICIAYMIPVLGFITWGMLGAFALGGVALAFISAYRQENPAPPRRERPTVEAEGVRPAAFVMPEASAAQWQSPPSATAGAAGASSPVEAVAPLLLSFPHAGFLDRLLAFVLDLILVVIVHNFLDFRNGNGFFLLVLAYHVGFWTWKQTTVGGIICQLRLVRVDGQPLRLVDSVVRGLSSIFSLAVLGIGALWILRDPERQSWHDKIAGTYVVKVPRNWPL